VIDKNKPIPNKTLLTVILMLGWILYVSYPNPLHLFNSISRLLNPPVMPVAVSDYARELDNKTPVEIEQFVYSRLPYSYDWEVYSMPWYFPSLDEALEKGTGDCKARYLLFASLLEELNIPYRKNVSLTHIWADYEGKPHSALENAGEAMVVIDEQGKLRVSRPEPDLSRAWRSFRQGFWEAMPGSRKYLLFSGFPVIHILFYLPWLNQSQHLPALGAGLPAGLKQKAAPGLPTPAGKVAVLSFLSLSPSIRSIIARLFN